MPAANFDRVARAYRWMEYFSFGPCLARCRNAQLANLQSHLRALVLGDGDGRFLKRLLLSQPTLTADIVDSSQAMLHILDARIRRLGPPARNRICLHHSDALSCAFTGSYDLVVSHFFLDCFFPDDLETILERVLAHSAPQVEWVISEFAIPRNTCARWLARGLISLLYRAFGLLTGLRVRTLPDYAAALLRRGFVRSHHRRFLGGLLCSQIWTRLNNGEEHSPAEMI